MGDLLTHRGVTFGDLGGVKIGDPEGVTLGDPGGSRWVTAGGQYAVTADTLIGLHICDVLLTVFGLVDNFLPFDGKLAFPGTVPFGFILPPGVADAFALVSPVPDFDLSALCHHGGSAAGTLT